MLIYVTCYNIRIICVDICAPQLPSSDLREIGVNKNDNFKIIRFSCKCSFPLKNEKVVPHKIDFAADGKIPGDWKWWPSLQECEFQQ